MKTKYLIIGGVTISLGAIMYLMSRRSGQRKVTSDNNRPSKSEKNVGVLYLPNWDQPFNQEFAAEVKRHLAPQKVEELDPALGKKLSKVILEAKGFFIDDEDQVEDIFVRQLGTKVHLSGLSKAFYKETGGKDLWKYLASFVSKGKINRWVNQLSNYRIQP